MMRSMGTRMSTLVLMHLLMLGAFCPWGIIDKRAARVAS